MAQSSETVFVTGAGNGIGFVTALRFANAGYRVAGADLSFSTEARQKLNEAGVECHDVDVRNVVRLTGVVDNFAAESGRLDVLVNNAGVGMVKQVEDVTEEDWQFVIDTNLTATFFGCRAAIRHMKAQGTGGSIVNVSSNAGLLPRAHDPVYSISKQAVTGLTKSLALCHSKDRIRVNAVCPGPVERTSMIEENFVNRDDRQQVVRELIEACPLARAWDRMVSPEEVADAVLYLASDAARMITGTSVAIDGGKSLGVPPRMS